MWKCLGQAKEETVPESHLFVHQLHVPEQVSSLSLTVFMYNGNNMDNNKSDNNS